MRSGLRAIVLPLLLLGLAACGPLAPAAAQETAVLSATNPVARLDAARTTLDGTEAALTRSDLTDLALQRLRAQIEPVALDLAAVVADLTPRADAAKARLAQLAPPPDAKDKTPAPAESPDISSERTAQEKLFADLDASLKRAKALLVQENQLETTITNLRRGIFARSILAQSYSLVDPRLWIPVVGELPADGRALQYLASDWWHGVASKIEGWQLGVAAGALILILIGVEPAQRVARRVSNRDVAATSPTRLRKVMAALGVALMTALVPVAAVVLAGLVLNLFGLVNTRLDAIASASARGVLIVAVTIGLARGFLAPRRANWRLPTISDGGADKLYRVAMVVSGLVAAAKIVEAVNDTIAAGLPTAVASRGLLAAAAAAALALTLNRLVPPAEAAGKPAPSRKPQGRDWTGPLRLLAWALIAIAVVALLTGFIAFASFFILQIVAVTNICVTLYLLLALADEGIEAVFENNRVLGRAFLQTLGLRRDSLDVICILLTGAIRVVLICVAILLALAPWRIESTDMLSTVQAAFVGIPVGDVTISLTTVIVAAVLFLAGIGATRALQRWLDVKLLPHTHLDTGLRSSIRTSLGYLGFLTAASLGLAHLGFSFERLAIVAGALSVGIGFGLQSIVNNFVSGLILLWERAVRVGDLVVVGGDQGYVRRINVRSTEIETPDRATVIVPNSNLVSGVVKNWVRNDHVGRIRLPFTFGVGTDPEKVRDILIATAKSHDHVLSIPSPQVLFTTLGEASLQIELLCFVEDVEAQPRTSSDLLFDIYRELRGIGLFQPAPPPTVTSPALDKLDAWLTSKVAEPPVPFKAARGG